MAQELPDVPPVVLPVVLELAEPLDPSDPVEDEVDVDAIAEAPLAPSVPVSTQPASQSSPKTKQSRLHIDGVSQVSNHRRTRTDANDHTQRVRNHIFKFK